MLKLFLFFPLFLLAQDIFPFPDEADNFNATLNKQIKKATKSISFLIPSLNNYTLQKELKSAAKRGVKITLITTKRPYKEDKISHLALFKGIYIYELKTNQEIKGSFICIDNKRVILLSQELDYKSLKNSYGFALQAEEKCENRISTLLLRSVKKE